MVDYYDNKRSLKMLDKHILVTLIFFCSSCGRDILEKGDRIESQSVDYSAVTNNPNDDKMEQRPFEIKFKIKEEKKGDICVAVFDSESEYVKAEDLKYVPKLHFLDCFNQSIGQITINLHPNKSYAIAAFHDLNKNGKLDTVGPLNIPTEGFGFSNYNKILPKPGRPLWNRVSFVPANYESMTIIMHYLF